MFGFPRPRRLGGNSTYTAQEEPMQRFLTNLGVPIARKDGERLGKLLEPDVERNTALGSLIKEVGNCDVRWSFVPSGLCIYELLLTGGNVLL